jgi:hypothetical protein
MGQTFNSDLEPIVGFLDESSLRSDPSRRRVINTPVVRYTEGAGQKRSWTVFGFLSLNGKDVVMVSEKAKAPDMAAFLELVREENGGSQDAGEAAGLYLWCWIMPGFILPLWLRVQLFFQFQLQLQQVYWLHLMEGRFNRVY